MMRQLFIVKLNQRFVFLEHFVNNILCISTEMLLVFSGKLFYINGFTIFQNDMCPFDLWKMSFENFNCIVHGHRNDCTAGLAGNFEASLMEWKKFQIISIFISSTFREDTDRNTGSDFFNCSEDSRKPLFDICTVEKESVQITHPV